MKMSYTKEFDESVTEKDGPMVRSAKARIQLLKADAEIARLRAETLHANKEATKITADWHRQNTEIKQLKAEVERLREALQKIANVAHHGGLGNYKNPLSAMNEIRRFSLPYWDKKECEQLQKSATQPLDPQ